MPDGVPVLEAGTVPLVLLHAFPLHSAMFEPMVAHLPDLPIVLVDLPGAGESGLVEPVSIEAAGLAVADTVRDLGAARAVIGGVSMGGYVVMAILRQVPEILAGMMLLHTKAGVDTADTVETRLALAEEVLASGSVTNLEPMAEVLVSAESKAHHPGLVDQLKAWIREGRPQGVAWAQRAMAVRQDSIPILRAAAIPTLIGVGSDDPFAPPREAEAMASALRGLAHSTLMVGVGHLGPVEAPELAARLVREHYHIMVGDPVWQ
jgi:pimeloyl-ACP methyl ester carboxylesterase